ncbi:MAG: methionyl-tRNA formyltransferase [Bacilli bacterium]|nr:methionyl-tRNA formyltransferase [Bacilli bacterium]
MKKNKVVFMGTPDFAVPILEKLIEMVDVILVVTQPDREVGRKKEIKFSPIKEVALKNNINIFQPEKIRLDYEEILNVNPDMIVTCAYGQIIPEVVLNTPKYGAINVHASLLPKYRGGAPIHRSIINGDEKTGITIMYMDKGMDTGDMISKKEYDIKPTDNVGILHDKLSLIGAQLLEETLPSIFAGTNNREKQNDANATYAPVIKREDEIIDFNLSGKEILNKIRGLNPWPLANFILNDKEVKVLEAEFVPSNIDKPGLIKILDKNNFAISCKDGLIYLKSIKPNGKNIMNIKDYLNGIDKDKVKKEGVINNEKN